MNRRAYFAWLDELVGWATAHPTVVGLVAVGSTAATDRQPDEFSDHDLFVVTQRGAATGLRSDLSWLPESQRIVMVHNETEHGRGVVYEDGHLVEVAVFDEDEMGLVNLNAYRVLVDQADLEPRLAAIADRTAAAAVANDADGTYRFQTFIEQLIVGLNRCARGEVLSANQRIRGDAATALVSLLGDQLPSEHRRQLDNLDPHRRFERAHPELGEQVMAALDADLRAAASSMLSIAERHLGGRVAVATPAAFGAVKTVIAATTSP